jgi:hypothetical protein
MFVPAVGIALVPGFVQMTLQLFFGITPAPPDSAHLLGRWRPAMTILIMAVLRLPVPGRLRGVLGLLLTHKGIVPPGNRPREDQFLPETQRTPPRRAQAPRHGDAYVQSRRMTKGNDIREITDKAGRDYFIGPDRSYYALLAGLVSTGSESGIARYRQQGQVQGSSHSLSCSGQSGRQCVHSKAEPDHNPSGREPFRPCAQPPTDTAVAERPPQSTLRKEPFDGYLTLRTVP